MTTTWAAIEKRKLVVALRKPEKRKIDQFSLFQLRGSIGNYLRLLADEVDDRKDESPQVCEQEEASSAR